ncbi:MAG: hypothetical protein Q7U98_12920 [Methylicorpusculum sp.]|uniref:hypothetical protein n=1 Tax=Methylicorpusculum sp. TaxID=2713644 RepID=UPI002719DF1B|nr:hypothetical protein [Methylicorpusculum sp.]MDO8845395.1 hypothetical protein [Methylicorpusculum sp.]MDO8940053.1 hypothetical protein [Methylicorpusculum sp.]MDP2201434.1 hypothetical protein [Methylicorpusculum sp.]
MINVALVKIQASVCAILLVLVIGEWWYWGSLNGEVEPGETTVSPAYDEQAFPQLKLDQQTEDSYTDLVSRPLFIEGRRPVPETDTDNSPNSQSSETLEWELTGVYTTQKKQSVLLRRTKMQPNQKSHIKISKDQEVDGWKLIEILPDKAVLERGGETTELILRKPKLKELPKTRQVPPPQMPLTPEMPPDAGQSEPIPEENLTQ